MKCFVDDTEEYTWDRVLVVLQPMSPTLPTIEDVLLTNNQILSLYALTLKQLKTDGDIFIYSKIIQWITCLKPR